MDIAYTMAAGRGDTDLLLFGVAERIVKKGYHPCGTVQTNTACDENGPCDMDVKVLPDGPVFRISQSLGRGARGCRLDPAALETSVGLVEANLNENADLLIINKFGKQEAGGRGFRPLIAQALHMDIPVLVGLNTLNKQAFLEFTDGLAVELDPNPDTLVDWLDQRIKAARTAA